jgi:hypothetical protein
MPRREQPCCADREQGVTALGISAEHGPKPQAIDGCSRAANPPLSGSLALALASILRPDNPSDEGAAGGGNPANCSHFCSHLADFGPTDPVRAGVYERTTASLLSSRSMVRIHQGAFQSEPEFSAQKPFCYRLLG